MNCTSCGIESTTLHGRMWNAKLGDIIKEDEFICNACASFREGYRDSLIILVEAEIQIRKETEKEARYKFIGYALYNVRVNRTAKGKDTMVGVIAVDDMYSNIKIAGHTSKWVATSKLKPYLDPDADGKQWLFLDYTIMEQDHPDLLKYAIYKGTEDDSVFVEVADTMPQAKQIILQDIRNDTA